MTTKLDGAQLLEAGFQLVISRNRMHVIRTPGGELMSQFDRITTQGCSRFAGDLAAAIREVLTTSLEREVKEDRKRTRASTVKKL